MRKHVIGLGLTLGSTLAIGALAGCQHDRDTTRVETTTTTRNAAREGADAAAKEAHAAIEPSKAPGQDNVRGVVHFMSTGTGVKVHAVITGLEPNSEHGFHIHQNGDLSAPDLMSAGGHFNPTGHKHGGAEGTQRHGGDLGNIKADDKGKATYEVTVDGLTIDDSNTGIVGKSVIVHEKADDLKSDPSGNSGARIAGGVIKSGRGPDGPRPSR